MILSLICIRLDTGKSSLANAFIKKKKKKQLLCQSISLQLDCGIHPGLEGMDALPYIDLIDPAEIDLLLISQ